MVWHSYHHAQIEEKQSQKRTFKFKIKLLVFTKNHAKQLILVAKGILKLNDYQRKIIRGWVITYIEVRVRDVSWRLAHEAKAGKVTLPVLDLLIILWAEGVITIEVKVAQSSTCSGYYLLKLLLLVPEAILLLVIALAVVVLLGVVILVGGVELLPLGVVSDEVGGVTALEAAPRWSPCRTYARHGTFSPVGRFCRRGCSRQRRQGKLQSRWDSGISEVNIMATNTSTSNKSLTNKGSIMVRTTLPRYFMRFELAKQFFSV
jgi:hypothetical protein